MKIKNLLCILSGDDYGIIAGCEKSEQNRFAGIGLFVLIIFACCFISSYFAFINLFPNYLIGIPLAFFFAFMITNIYLLLLYTLSKNVLPHKRNIKTRILAISLRILFICFIAVVVSKPIEALLFSGVISRDIAEYKEQKLIKYTSVIENFTAAEINQFRQMIDMEISLGRSDSDKILKYERLISAKEKEKSRMLSDMRRLIENSNYYIYGIVILNTQYPFCWLITLLSIAIFLIPAVLKNFLSEKSAYYRRKRKVEVILVHDAYQAFKTKYRSMINELFGADVYYPDHFVDSPFNTIPKIDNTRYLTEETLLSDLYNA